MKLKKKHSEMERQLNLKLAQNNSLDKYTDPEFAPEKLKKIEHKFVKQIVHD